MRRRAAILAVALAASFVVVLPLYLTAGSGEMEAFWGLMWLFSIPVQLVAALLLRGSAYSNLAAAGVRQAVQGWVVPIVVTIVVGLLGGFGLLWCASRIG